MTEIDLATHDGFYAGTMFCGKKYPGSNYTVIRTLQTVPNEWRVIAGKGGYSSTPDPRNGGHDVVWSSYVHAAKLSLHGAIRAARELAVEWRLS